MIENILALVSSEFRDPFMAVSAEAALLRLVLPPCSALPLGSSESSMPVLQGCGPI